MKEVLYTPLEHFKEVDGIKYFEKQLINNARDFLKKNSEKSDNGCIVVYSYGDCIIRDLDFLGLKICSKDESKINSLASKLFPKENASRG